MNPFNEICEIRHLFGIFDTVKSDSFTYSTLGTETGNLLWSLSVSSKPGALLDLYSPYLSRDCCILKLWPKYLVRERNVSFITVLAKSQKMCLRYHFMSH